MLHPNCYWCILLWCRGQNQNAPQAGISVLKTAITTPHNQCTDRANAHFILLHQYELRSLY